METKTLEDNKKIARQTFEAFEKHDLNLLDALTDQNKFKMHLPGIAEPLNFKEAKEFNNEYNKAFPDAKVSIDFQVAEGEYVFTRVTYNGTNTGEFQGMPASNKKTTVTGSSIQRIVNGKIVEEWDEFDQLGMLKQIGAIPEMETTKG